MNLPIQHGYLVLADISGYTSFLAKSELDHAQDILRSVLTLLIGELTPTLELAEVEGDAVFAHAPASKISRGELLLELVEAAYVAFRDRQRTMEHNATCPCNACQAISTLDLKFITHYGDYVLQNIGGTNKPLGSCVNLIHRMLKNRVREATGWRGYAMFSEASLDHMGVRPEGMHEGVEAYEHLGAVRTYSINLDARYTELLEGRRMFLPPEEADIVLTHAFSAPPPIVWDWLTNPTKRALWMQGASWAVKERPRGRTGPGAQNHCATLGAIEHILDWRPFQYFTAYYRRGFLNMMVTGELEPTPDGTHLHWNMRLDSPLPRWMLCPIRKFLSARARTRVRRRLETIEQLISGVAVRERVC